MKVIRSLSIALVIMLLFGSLAVFISDDAIAQEDTSGYVTPEFGTTETNFTFRSDFFYSHGNWGFVEDIYILIDDTRYEVSVVYHLFEGCMYKTQLSAGVHIYQFVKVDDQTWKEGLWGPKPDDYEDIVTYYSPLREVTVYEKTDDMQYLGNDETIDVDLNGDALNISNPDENGLLVNSSDGPSEHGPHGYDHEYEHIGSFFELEAVNKSIDDLNLTISYQYNDEAFHLFIEEHHLDVNDIEIALYYWHEGEWEQVEDCTLSMSDHTVSAHIGHLTTFGLFVEYPPDEHGISSDEMMMNLGVVFGAIIAFCLVVIFYPKR